ncbi:MAG: hypothetical protein L6R48_13765, partial [Planctomycetes bacterium]|nr:hypothetical protein [Planctomycetota bacterium]
PDSTFRLDLKVAIPAFVAKKAGSLTLADLIPARGALLIDDEHLRYENVVPASGQLTSVHRGVRQDSVIGSPDLFKWS